MDWLPSIGIFFNPVVLIGVACTLFVYFSTSTHGFWRRQKIKFKRPLPFFGNISQFIFMRQSFHECIHELYKHFRDEPFGGFYQMRDPILLIRDPDLIHTILVTEFKRFNDHGIELINVDKELNPLTVHLFSAKGDEWRGLRRKIIPIFTSGKLKGMESQVSDCVHKLNSYLENKLNESDGNIDLKSVFERLTMDVIGSCAFGIECDSLEENSQFSLHGRKVFQPNFLQVARAFVGVFSKKLLKTLKVPDLPGDTKNFFLNLVLDTMKYRRRNNIHRPDLLQLLMDSQNSFENPENAPEGLSKKPTIADGDVFDEIHVAANSFLFFVAGFETTASTLSFCLYELAINQDIQDRLREGIENVYSKHNQCLSIEALNEFPYLNAVVAETLRKYPPLPWLMRRVEEDWLIPNTNKLLPKGTSVLIPTWSIQHDWQYYPNPEVFNPERFLGEHEHNIRKGTYMPFGDGPRKCAGDRFALMEVKLALADFILKYSVSPCSRTKIPLEFLGGTIMMMSKNGIWINVTKRRV